MKFRSSAKHRPNQMSAADATIPQCFGREVFGRTYSIKYDFRCGLNNLLNLRKAIEGTKSMKPKHCILKTETRHLSNNKLFKLATGTYPTTVPLG